VKHQETIPPLSEPLLRQPTSRAGSRFIDLALVVLTTGLGCWFWLYFFGFGRLSLTLEDWPMHGYYLNIGRLSLTHGTLPWVVNWSSQGTDRFLANPETYISPLLLLLPWVSNGWFVALEVCLSFGIGVWGWWVLKGEMNWSRLTFVVAVVVASFNGYIVSRLAVGHLMWCGYFLSPWVLFGIHRMLISPDRRLCWAPLSFAFFALFLFGSFHIAIWWFLFLGIACLAQPRLLVPASAAVLSACAMACFRILPAIVFLHERSAFLTGYPSLEMLVRGFTKTQAYRPTPRAWGPEILGWWEYDHYVGWAVVVFVVFFTAVILLFWRRQTPFVRPITAASLGMAVLSYGSIYSWVYSLPLVIFRSERVSSRFICLSFLGFLWIALTGLERAQRGRFGFAAKFCAVLVLPFALHSAWVHAQLWLLPRLESTTPFSWYYSRLQTLVPAIVATGNERDYQAIVLGSLVFSFLSFLVLSALYFPPTGRLLFDRWRRRTAHASRRADL